MKKKSKIILVIVGALFFVLVGSYFYEQRHNRYPVNGMGFLPEPLSIPRKCGFVSSERNYNLDVTCPCVGDMAKTNQKGSFDKYCTGTCSNSCECRLTKSVGLIFKKIEQSEVYSCDRSGEKILLTK